MENQTRINIIFILALIATFVYVGETDEFGVPINEPTHECRDKETKAYCYELTSSGKTCYTLPGRKGGKRCLIEPYWEDIPVETITQIPSQVTSSNTFPCTKDGCG